MRKIKEQKHVERYEAGYEIFMMLLSLVAVTIVIIQLTYTVPSGLNKILTAVDTLIWVVFVVDYVMRFLHAQDKKVFVKGHVIDLLTILPFAYAFRTMRILRFARLTRLLYLLRLTRGLAFLHRFTRHVKQFMNTNSFHIVVVGTMVSVVLGGLAMAFVEKMPLQDALWWSIVTVTTVGYGDIVPKTLLGRVIASAVMLIGIAFMGMTTGTISTYFLNKTKEDKQLSYKEELISQLQEKLNHMETLTVEDVEMMHGVLLELVTQKELIKK